MTEKNQPDQNRQDIRPDAWARFESAVDAAVKSGPKHRTPKTADNVVIGCLPPQGCRWQFLGSWPSGRTMDILREMGQLDPQP